MHIYLVGGAVRDELLGLNAADKDYVVVGADIKTMLNLGYKQVGLDFPVFLHPKTNEEYALARTEVKKGQGYKGFSFDFNKNVSLVEDLKRRDITINAIAKDIETNEIIDPYKGQDDLNNKIIRHVSDAFIEDPLRVLRVARFAAKLHSLHFSVAHETIELMTKIADSGELKTLTPERIWMEIEKALKTPSPAVFFHILHKTHALKEVLPELDALYGVPGPKRWHPEIDSFIHTLMTLDRISHDTEDPVTRFAMLCHDLGKGLTPPELYPHHPLHNVRGLNPLRDLCKRLKVPKAYEDFAKIVVFNHSYMHHLYKNGAASIVDLFNALDAYRRPERVKPFALCCRADFLGRKGFENRPFPRYEYFLAMFSLTYHNINVKEFIDKGLKGEEIKKAIYNRRVELIQQFMQDMPKNELNDSNNEEAPASLLNYLKDI